MTPECPVVFLDCRMIKKSRNTISRATNVANSVNHPLDQLNSLSDDELKTFLFPKKKLMPVYAQPDYVYCHKELTKLGVTLSSLYHEFVFFGIDLLMFLFTSISIF